METHTRVRSMMSNEQTIQMLQCLDALSQCPAVVPKPTQSMLSNVQTLVINSIVKMSPFGENHDAWMLVVAFGLEHLRRAVSATPSGDSNATKEVNNCYLAACSMAESYLTALCKILEACETPTTQCEIFRKLANGLHKLSITTALPSKIQAVLITLVKKQLEHGPAAVVEHMPVELPVVDREMFWEELGALIRTLLSLHCSTAPER